MPTKHIDDATWRKVEKETVKAVIHLQASVKDTEVLRCKQDRRALPYNPLLPPRAQEAGTEELSLPPELRLLAEVVQGFAPPGTPFVTASADKPGSRPLTCRGFRRGLMTRKSKKPLGVRLRGFRRSWGRCGLA